MKWIATALTHLSLCASNSIWSCCKLTARNSWNRKNNVCQDCCDLHNAIAAVNDIAEENLVDQNTVYDINIAVKDILQYIKHLVHYVQWRKAKVRAFENINEEAVFWFRGYCQKIFQWDFVKGRRSILGRK